MNVWVTGANGQVGYEWAQLVRAKGWDLLAPGSNTLDLTDGRKVDAFLDEHRPDWIVNCAAWTDVDGAEANREAAFAMNRDAAARLAHWTASTGNRFIHYSTDYVFPGHPSDRERYPKGYPEEAPTGPLNVYGESKRAGEVAVLDRNPRALILRLSWVCGAHGSNFLKTMLKLGAERDRLQVVDDQIGTPTWASTVPPFSLALAERSKEGIFHLSQSGVTSWYGLAKELFRVVGRTVEIEPVPTTAFPRPAPRPRYSRLSLDKLAVATGMVPPDWREGLPELVHQIERG